MSILSDRIGKQLNDNAWKKLLNIAIDDNEEKPPEKQIFDWRPTECLHDGCSECGGTGRKKRDGTTCVHMISCRCKRCTPWFC